MQFLPATAKRRSKAHRCWSPGPREAGDPCLSSVTFPVHRPGPQLLLASRFTLLPPSSPNTSFPQTGASTESPDDLILPRTLKCPHPMGPGHSLPDPTPLLMEQMAPGTLGDSVARSKPQSGSHACQIRLAQDTSIPGDPPHGGSSLSLAIQSGGLREAKKKHKGRLRALKSPRSHHTNRKQKWPEI